jgi:hypothetical protein
MSNYSYVISKNSTGTTEAYNTATKSVQFSSPNPTTVFNNVLSAGGGSGGTTAVKNGIYEVDNNILLKSFTGLVGESMSNTIIRAKAGFNDNTIFRYWQGASSTPLEGFKLSNLKLELNVNTSVDASGVNNRTDAAWISSGTKDLELDHVWVYSKKSPTISRIGFFIDNAQGSNNNVNLKIHDCRFEGSCKDQDMLGLGNVYYGDVSHNVFLNNTAQALGIGATYHSIYSNNHFENVETNTIGLEWKCEDNLISNNVCWNTGGIKLSGGWEQNSINYSKNNTCINNVFNYGVGGIEAAISIDDVISGNKFYRTKRNGIQGSFLRTVIKDNIFTDTNWSNSSDGLIGNNTPVRTGGIIAYNSNSTMMPKNEWNSFSNNYFIKSGEKYTVEGVNGQQQGFTNGVVIDTKYLNSFIKNNEGNLGAEMLKNFGTAAP